uniref:SGNH/GDSL hydrolase family protein n=1 Tax=Acinetobacter sp. TaxID=472 RepID=UPI00388D1131
ITDAYNAAKSWTRTFQTTSPITGGAWVSNNPADNIATTSKIGGVKVGAGLNVTSDGTLSVIVPSQVNPFSGKKIVCFGDSITEFKTYPQQVGQMLGAEGINVGFGGCMMAAHWDAGYKEMCMYRLADYIASGDYSGLIAAAQDLFDRTGDDNRAIVARLAAIDWNTVDYVTIFYGTNDYANGKSLGLATDIKSDGSNYLGSANYVIQRLQTAYPHLKIALITPIYRARGANGGTDSDDSPNAATNGKYLREFAAGLIEVAKLNHIPCFNMYDESGINKYTKGLYLNPDPDGVHLTDVGATHIAQKLAAKMRANF